MLQFKAPTENQETTFVWADTKTISSGCFNSKRQQKLNIDKYWLPNQPRLTRQLKFNKNPWNKGFFFLTIFVVATCRGFRKRFLAIRTREATCTSIIPQAMRSWFSGCSPHLPLHHTLSQKKIEGTPLTAFLKSFENPIARVISIFWGDSVIQTDFSNRIPCKYGMPHSNSRPCYSPLIPAASNQIQRNQLTRLRGLFTWRSGFPKFHHNSTEQVQPFWESYTISNHFLPIISCRVSRASRCCHAARSLRHPPSGCAGIGGVAGQQLGFTEEKPGASRGFPKNPSL